MNPTNTTTPTPVGFMRSIIAQLDSTANVECGGCGERVDVSGEFHTGTTDSLTPSFFHETCCPECNVTVDIVDVDDEGIDYPPTPLLDALDRTYVKDLDGRFVTSNAALTKALEMTVEAVSLPPKSPEHLDAIKYVDYMLDMRAAQIPFIATQEECDALNAELDLINQVDPLAAAETQQYVTDPDGRPLTRSAAIERAGNELRSKGSTLDLQITRALGLDEAYSEMVRERSEWVRHVDDQVMAGIPWFPETTDDCSECTEPEDTECEKCPENDSVSDGPQYVVDEEGRPLTLTRRWEISHHLIGRIGDDHISLNERITRMEQVVTFRDFVDQQLDSGLQFAPEDV